ncbi:MAG TPA: hypothetical protein VF511_07610, partial [Chthoniobacterales bacterium]
MKKPIFVIAISLAFIFALALPRRDASAQRSSKSSASGKLTRAKDISLRVLEERGGKQGITYKNDLKAKRVFTDDLNKTHTRFEQTHKGIPVFGGEAIVHLNPDDSVFAVTDDLVEAVQVDTEAYRSPEEAVRTAISDLGCDDCLTAAPATDLQILRHEGNDYLTYRVQLWREDGTHET